MRLVVTGGGTGGHVYPAIAVATRFLEEPGGEVLYVGSAGGPEKDAAAAAGIDFEGIDLAGFAGKSIGGRIKATTRFARGLRRAKRILRLFEPDCVFGTGGYASAPASFSAAVHGIPLVLLEMNSDPGIVTRLLARRARAIASPFEVVSERIRKGRVVVTGVPVREEIDALSGPARELSRFKGMKRFELEPGRLTMLVFGGSQGARAINEAVFSRLPALSDRDELQVLHVTGTVGVEEALTWAVKLKGSPLIYRPVSYVEEIYLAYAVSDLAVSRAGAGAIAELSAAGVPSVLVPFPYATGGHQESNAEQAAAEGWAVNCPQAGDSADAGIDRALRIIWEPEELASMSGAASSRRGSGTEGVAALIEEVMSGSRPGSG